MYYPEICFNTPVHVFTSTVFLDIPVDSQGIARFVSKSKRQCILLMADNLINDSVIERVRRFLSIYSVIIVSPDISHPIHHPHLFYIQIPIRCFNEDTFLKVEGIKHVGYFGGVSFDIANSIANANKIDFIKELEQEVLPPEKSILIRDFDGLGDILMLLPTLKAYCEKGYTVDVSIRYPEVVENLPYVHRVYDESKGESINMGTYGRFYDLSFRLSAYENEICRQHRIKATAELAGLHFEEVAVRPDIILTGKEIEIGKSFVAKGTKKYKVALGLFSADARRGYPPEQIKELVEIISKENDNVDLFLLGQRERNKQEIPLCFDLRGQTSIRELFSIVNACDAVVCIDSSVLHVAGALKKPTLLIPSTVPGRWRNYPETIILNPPVKCFPCYDRNIKNCRNNIHGGWCAGEVDKKTIALKLKECLK